VDYCGVIPHAEVPAILAENALFFLPTRGENYGYAIHEALAAGLPVLISDQTPWRQLEKSGVGWDLPLDDPARFAAVIKAQFHLDEDQWATQRKMAKEYARQVAGDNSVRDRNLSLFTDLLPHERR